VAVRIQVAFDCHDPAGLARFWAEALGYQEEPPPPGFDDWPAFLRSVEVPEDQGDRYAAVVDPDGAGPRVFFQKVPEDKVVKNRVHPDLSVSGGRGRTWHRLPPVWKAWVRPSWGPRRRWGPTGW